MKTQKVIKAMKQADKNLASRKEAPSALTKEDRKERMLMEQNPYAQTLVDPFNVHGCKIPDQTMYPSVPFTLVDRITLSANGQGVAGMALGLNWEKALPCYGTMVPNKTDLVTRDDDDLVGTIFGTSATPTQTNTNGAGSGAPYYYPNWDTSVRGTFSKVRLVSLGLHVTNTGTITTAQGKITGCSAPRDYFRIKNNNGSGINISVDDIAKVPGAKVVPLSHKEGLSIIYQPLDYNSLNYAELQEPFDVSTIGSMINKFDEYKGCEIVVVVDGATINQSILATLVANFEGVPKTNAFLLTSADKIAPDSVAIDHAFEIAENSPSVIAADPIESPTETLEKGLTTKQPVVHHETVKNQQDSIVSTMMGGLDKVMNSDIVKGVKEFTPLIEGALSLL